MSGRTVTLRLSARVANDVELTVAYAVDSGNGPLQDEAGNGSGGLQRPALTNLNVGPRFRRGTVSGVDIVLTYSEALAQFSVPALDAFVVQVEGDW